MKTADEVIQADLQYICSQLAGELERLAGKRLLVVGGAGFLGYYLVQAVLHFNGAAGRDRAIELTVFDNFIRGTPPWLMALQNRPGLTLHKHDIIKDELPEHPAFDYIIHAASIASPTYYRKYPIETMDANVYGLRKLLDYATARRTNRPVEGILYFSTSEIYGDPTPDAIPTPETYRGNVSCTGPRACYDESKRYGETLCVNFAGQYDVPIKIARPFNNYGPGLKITDRRVIPDFVRDIFAGRDIVMLSDGSPTRTFCYVADAIVGYFKILVKGRKGEPYNIGVEEPEISMARLASKIVALGAELVGYPGRVVFKQSAEAAYLTDNPQRRCPVIAKARNELGYDPQISIDEGLERSLIWYRENKVAEEA